MREGRCVLLGADGAERLARERGLAIVEPSYFSTPPRLIQWRATQVHDRNRAVDDGGADLPPDGPRSGTVGAVARDRDGHLAAATSTGGLTNKVPSRIGDTPIVGAGVYANDATCAVSCTGTGEHFIRSCAAHDVHARMRYPEPGHLARRGRQHRSIAGAARRTWWRASRCHTMVNSRSHSIPLECSAAGCARATRRWRQFSPPDTHSLVVRLSVRRHAGVRAHVCRHPVTEDDASHARRDSELVRGRRWNARAASARRYTCRRRPPARARSSRAASAASASPVSCAVDRRRRTITGRSGAGLQPWCVPHLKPTLTSASRRNAWRAHERVLTVLS